jgi:hypothetical protein
MRKIMKYRPVLFCAGIMFLKKVKQIKIAQIEHIFPFKTVYFLGIGGLTTSSCIVCDYTTSGHMDL